MNRIFQKDNVKDIVLSVLVAVCVSIVLVLLFALLVKYLYLDENAVLIGNTVIKLLSIFFGIFMGYKHREMGVIKGALSGLIYILLSYFTFSLLAGNSLFAGLNIWGVLFGIIIGIISGIITVNVRK